MWNRVLDSSVCLDSSLICKAGGLLAVFIIAGVECVRLGLCKGLKMALGVELAKILQIFCKNGALLRYNLRRSV